MTEVVDDSIESVTSHPDFDETDNGAFDTISVSGVVLDMDFQNPQNTEQGGQQPSSGGQGGQQPPPGGLVRPRRRVIGNRGRNNLSSDITRNYQVSAEFQFTNFVELKNDMISPEYAQEIIEEIMSVSSVDMANQRATRMVEDVIFTFYIENAASQKTGHEKIVDVYGREFDMMVVLNVLVSHGVTPRRFTRGLAKRIHAFLRAPENAPLRADLVRRYSLDDPDHAAIAFDGSTHIPNITVELKQVADMLASRGIFENAASIKNASERTTFDGALKQQQMKAGALHLT